MGKVYLIVKTYEMESLLLYLLVAVTSSGIAFAKQKLGVTLKYDKQEGPKQDIIDF